ncbi:hypothetical protein J7T55_004260 [Diaporthe amygdali]|uniref:uncharacterized protein n=1 Tax=Phomopsis amygdali TaxID=1214568 RepID=UPI0022FE187D|nr:uncharacterized protein J7T55_004260 [Diaporthe amygdali]KAJ0100749.1 hypothetical protein J7T55_004260 [Diaporthe amygdali]
MDSSSTPLTADPRVLFLKSFARDYKALNTALSGVLTGLRALNEQPTPSMELEQRVQTMVTETRRHATTVKELMNGLDRGLAVAKDAESRRKRGAVDTLNATREIKRSRTRSRSEGDITYGSAAQVRSQTKRPASDYQRGGIGSQQEITQFCSEEPLPFASTEAPQSLGSRPNIPVDTAFEETSDGIRIYGPISSINQIAKVAVDPPSELFATRRSSVDQEEQCGRSAGE